MKKHLAQLWYRWADSLQPETQRKFEGGLVLLAMIAIVFVLAIGAVVRVGYSLVYLFGVGIWIPPNILPEPRT
jgi:hypothetical protein